mmetsp:Transcript_30137/g.64768  ORF Transcript_30137/g.64768 Transcript_30137/m.64768 type:complete len:243 (-) Transcript_30137:455-1183(-)
MAAWTGAWVTPTTTTSPRTIEPRGGCAAARPWPSMQPNALVVDAHAVHGRCSQHAATCIRGFKASVESATVVAGWAAMVVLALELIVAHAVPRLSPHQGITSIDQLIWRRQHATWRKLSKIDTAVRCRLRFHGVYPLTAHQMCVQEAICSTALCVGVQSGELLVEDGLVPCYKSAVCQASRELKCGRGGTDEQTPSVQKMVIASTKDAHSGAREQLVEWVGDEPPVRIHDECVVATRQDAVK